MLYRNTLLEGSLEGIGTPWLSQYTDQLFQPWLYREKNKGEILLNVQAAVHWN